MTSYQNDIMDLLHGDTPKAKYEYLLTIISERDKFAISFLKWKEKNVTMWNGNYILTKNSYGFASSKDDYLTSEQLLEQFKQAQG